MTASKTRRRLLVAFAFTGLVSLTLPATAQQPAPAPAPKEEEVVVLVGVAIPAVEHLLQGLGQLVATGLGQQTAVVGHAPSPPAA